MSYIDTLDKNPEEKKATNVDIFFRKNYAIITLIQIGHRYPSQSRKGSRKLHIAPRQEKVKSGCRIPCMETLHFVAVLDIGMYTM